MARTLSRVGSICEVGVLVTVRMSVVFTSRLPVFGCIEDWSGILSEGPISGDIIEQDWVDGAIWQQRCAKTYSFDVPFTGSRYNPINPNIWDS